MAFDDSQEHNFSFADFEVNLAALELRKGGIKIHLEGQPIRVLCVLLERHGKVVTRKELKESLWADNTFVDFDNGVNQAISKIRRVLGDSSVRPRFVETLPRRGYRFIQTELLNGSGHSGLDADHRIDDPLARYKVLADIEESDDSIKYVAEDTELHRPVAIRVSPQSSAEKTERAQHRKLPLALAAAALGVFLALVFAVFPPFSPSPGIVGPMRRFTLPTDGVPAGLSFRRTANMSPICPVWRTAAPCGSKTWTRMSHVRSQSLLFSAVLVYPGRRTAASLPSGHRAESRK